MTRSNGERPKGVGQIEQMVMDYVWAHGPCPAEACREARWNSNMQEINRRAGEFGRQMGELGRQIGEMASGELQRWRHSSEQMRQPFENAIASGGAKPE
jgi:hypothetical protein